MDTVRLVRDMGDFRLLLPEGISSVRDLPYTLFDACRQALVYLGFDELPSEERPPRRIWTDGKKLREWFDVVKANRERDMDPRKQIEDPVQNEAAEALIVGG